ncbi:MAG: flagellar hook-associated protein FlgK [Calditrichaeota bacterium]|nr:flagellar hook-associated protein FlgK [Calditrichota bacterium]MCB9366000.1 flagellar hook-associated protein FlgK [Calditrichota bacterium]MCB9391874.1 flagellar hook-associated protein FlgK [Calditrichota bacterium]
MSTLSNILEQGRRALQVQQLQMQVIGHNTSNAGTVGYSRRRLDLSTAPPGQNGILGVGAGVDVDRLARVRDTILDNQIRQGTSTASYWTARDEQLGQVEDVFNAMGDRNLGTMLDSFWQGWHDLANDPESMASRFVVRDRANDLVNTLKRVHDSLSSQLEDVNSRISAGAEQVNSLTSAIAELNVQITSREIGGEEASDLRDSRDLLVEQLSELTDISVQEQSDGSLNVYTGGHIIVQRDLSVPLNVDIVESDPKHKVVLTLGGSAFEWKPVGGELGALYEQRDIELPRVLEQLDQFAADFAQAVNQIHATGWGLNGSFGQEFFTSGVTGVENLELSEVIQADPSAIASASNENSPGDNSLALAIAELRNYIGSTGSSLDQQLRNIPLDTGSRRASAKQQMEIENTVLENAVNKRFAISGVSLDEEMAKLIETQKAYEAAAKIVQVVNQMMETVINLKQ